MHAHTHMDTHSQREVFLFPDNMCKLRVYSTLSFLRKITYFSCFYFCLELEEDVVFPLRFDSESVFPLCACTPVTAGCLS